MRLIVFIQLCLVPGLICAAEPPVRDSPVGDPPSSSAKAIAETFATEHPDRILVIGVLEDGQRTFFAKGKMPAGQPNADQHTLFEIGSISKTFVGTALASLVQDGVLKYDQTVREFVPDRVKLNPSVGAITLKQLATHTSGLPRVARSRILKSIFTMTPYGGSRDTLNFDLSLLTVEPTEHPNYSNMGVGLLGDILSRVEGKPLEQVIRERVTKPLDLKDTVVTLSDEQKTRFAPGFFGQSEAKPWSKMGTGTGAGGIRSTADELLIYAEAVVTSPRGEVGPSLADAIRPRVRYDGRNWAIGLCWHSVVDDGDLDERPAVAFHNGSTYSHVSALVIEPAAKRAVVVLINGTQDKSLPAPLYTALALLGRDLK